MIDDTEQDLEPVAGHVKWFDPGKGFGFVVAQEGGPDILLHANVLRNFGQNSVADGAQVKIMVQDTDRGRQAVLLLSIDPPAVPAAAGLADFADIDPDELAAAPIVPARVKWFDKVKGYGFANAFGATPDIFIHMEVLRRSGLADLQPGEAVGIRIIEGQRGQMAAEILSWDMAGRICSDD